VNIFEQLVQDIKLPKMSRIRQKFLRPVLEDVSGVIREQLQREGVLDRIKNGDKVAITAGSRGIENFAAIVRELVTVLKERGAKPFLVPAMGSHGGATAEGQTAVLRCLGITEETVGAKICSTMEVVRIGTTDKGIPVCFDKYAYDADATIVINRIKPHTCFRGSIESGLAKMIAIGLGKQIGAEMCHATGLSNMSARVEEIARVAIEKSNIAFGIGIIENAYDETSRIVAIPRQKIIDEEPEFLIEAKENLPQMLLGKCDVLVVDEIGKNISGTGMDPNIVKRFTSEAIVCRPLAQRIVVLDLTKETHGNATGIGLADICTRRLYEKIDFYESYPNSLTSRVLMSVKIPMVMDNDRQAMKAAVKACFDIDYDDVRIMRIKNTLKLEEIHISENLLDEAMKNPRIEILSVPKEMAFDENGNLFN